MAAAWLEKIINAELWNQLLNTNKSGSDLFRHRFASLLLLLLLLLSSSSSN
jgi:hypothetical protein